MSQIKITKEYKKYPKYKDSGIVWLGQIPEEWRTEKVKFLGKTLAGGTPETENKEYWEGGKIPWLPSGAVQNSTIDTNEAEKFITELGLKESATKEIKANSVLIALTGATCANVGYLTFDATANQSVVAIHNYKDVVDSKFLYYSFLANREQFLVYKTGGAQSGINEQDVKNIFNSVPALTVQEKIAEYLDDKTGLIDKIIEKKQQLLELLAEKRKVLISDAVTGKVRINDKLESTKTPASDLRDSGIPWLGQIPRDWKVEKLKYLSPIRNTKIEKKDDTRYIGLENVESETGRIIDVNDNQEVESIVNVFKTGDVLFGKLRPYLAKVFQAEYDGVCTGELLVLKQKNDKIIGKYLFYRLLEQGFIKIVNDSTYGSKMPRANWEFIGNLNFSFSDVSIQKIIVKFLDKKITELNELNSAINNSINLLQEYKISLISNAVTGKIHIC